MEFVYEVVGVFVVVGEDDECFDDVVVFFVGVGDCGGFCDCFVGDECVFDFEGVDVVVC